MNKKDAINIAYVSDFPIVRCAIGNFLSEYNIETVFTTGMHTELNKGKYLVDIIVIEFQKILPEISLIIKATLKENPGSKLIIAGVFNNAEVANRIINLGAKGYYDLHSTGGIEELATTIKTVYEGGTVIIPSPYQSTHLFNDVNQFDYL